MLKVLVRPLTPLLILSLLAFAACKQKKDAAEASKSKAAALKLPEGFVAEHLYSPGMNNQGSWVAMTFDNKGRLIASDQYGALYRVVIPPAGDTAVTVEPLVIGKASADSVQKVSIGYAQGLLYAFNSLFVMINNETKEFDRQSGLYRLFDTDNDDQFDSVTVMKELRGAGEHGPHSIKLSPDGKSLFVIAGNFTDVPEMDAYRLPKVWKEDNLIPLIKDPRGHANNRSAPGGWIAKVDPETNTWELFSAGFRNAYDLAFNEHGELFAYDSDMEWDLGMPWYRPTRICHVTSGSEFGWRTGNSVWPETFADNLPPVLNIGQGSPTSLEHGMNSAFPGQYRSSLFAFDWSFGIIYSVALKPAGATYMASAQEFVSGAPLPLTDGMFGPDGALYFMTGGRRLESDLYRVYYKGSGSEVPAKPVSGAGIADLPDMQLRRKLEQFHSPSVKVSLDEIWPHLSHPDRFVRYAARVAVEHQPLKAWRERALSESNSMASIQAMIALARHDAPGSVTKIVQSLTRINFSALDDRAKSDFLRACELVIARMGPLNNTDKARIITYLDPHYPAATNALNRSLSKVLLHLDASSAVAETVALLETARDDSTDQVVTASADVILRNPQYGLQIAGMLSNMPPSQQSYYAVVLSQVKSGWTDELREKYFSWFRKAFCYKGGHSYVGFINKARQMALAQLPEANAGYYDDLSGKQLLTSSGNDLATGAPDPKGPGRRWTVDDAMNKIDSSFTGLDFQNGKDMFAATRCISCHAMLGEGGAIGPDLTQLHTRFSTRDMLEHIILPNKEVSDQYAATVLTLSDGTTVFGRLVGEDEDSYSMSQNPFAPEVVRNVLKKDVVDKKYSRISVMMPGLVNRLNEEELKNLIAYLMAGGNSDHALYKKAQ